MSSKSAPLNYLLPVDASYERNQVFDELIAKVACDPTLVNLLECSFIPEERDRLTNSLQNLLPNECCVIIKDPWVAFMTYCKWVLLNFIVNSIAEAYL